jgi:hypothetical protein
MIRLYALLLRLYPRAFYERFAEDMLDVFKQVWHDLPPGPITMLGFILHELAGLMRSVVTEHAQAHSGSPLRFIFRQRLIPVWLLGCSLFIAGLISISYWGYLSVSSSRISVLHTVDQIALVQFDAANDPSVIPIQALPFLGTEVFPPSQILSRIPAHLIPDAALNPTLTAQLMTALQQEGIALAPRIEHPAQPRINPNGCGPHCFQMGVHMQSDGHLQVTYPEMLIEGPSAEGPTTIEVTPNDWWYYLQVMPAGFVVQGTNGEGQPLVFTAVANPLGGDRFRYSELVFLREAEGLRLVEQLHYHFDVSGLEGITFPIITVIVFALLMVIWLVTCLLDRAFRFVADRLPVGA